MGKCIVDDNSANVMKKQCHTMNIINNKEEFEAEVVASWEERN